MSPPMLPSLKLSGIQGWKRAMAEHGLPTEGLLETGDFGFESGARAARALLDAHPDCTAIIASSGRSVTAISCIDLFCG